MKLNKYSNKCYHLIKNNKYWKMPNVIPMLFVNKVYQIMETTTISTQFKINKQNIKKLYTNGYPQIYHILNNNNQMTFEQFYSWYHTNLATINIPQNKINKNKNKNSERTILNSFLFNNPFISLDIHILAETNDLIYESVEVENIKINLFTFKGCDDMSYKLDTILFICKFMSNLAESFMNLNLTILCSPLKKRIYPNNGPKLTALNINSGSSVRYLEIKIWRYEELEKVLIHELIHFLGIDKVNDNELVQLNRYYDKTFSYIGSDYHIESYTESLAIIIYSVYNAFKMTDINLVKNFLEIEINWSLFQIAKILNFFKMQNFNNIFRNSNNNRIKQTTSVLSYFFVKTGNIFNIIGLLDLFGKSIMLGGRIGEYTKLIDNSIHNKELEMLVGQYLDLIKNHATDGYVWNCLRMSCIHII